MMSFPFCFSDRCNRAVAMEVYISSVKEFLSVPAAQIQKCQLRPATVNEGEVAVRLRRALRRVDRELEKGNSKAALSLVKQLKAHPAGLLRGFGAASAKVPRTVLSLDDRTLAGESEISSLQLLVDAILCSIKRSLEFQLQEEETEILVQDSGAMMDVEKYGSINEDHLMCMQHEAGHFLVGYMLGVLPRRYKVPSVEDLLQDKFARGMVEFVGFEFLRDVGVDVLPKRNFSKGKLNNETLKKFSCVILGGLAAEHLLFGYSELLHSDVLKLDRVLKWLGLTENEVDSETRQAAEAAVLILSFHCEAHSRLAEAMALGRSVGFCIEMIERTLNFTSNEEDANKTILIVCHKDTLSSEPRFDNLSPGKARTSAINLQTEYGQGAAYSSDQLQKNQAELLFSV